MNKNTFFLLITLGIVLTIFSYKFYKNAKKETLQEAIKVMNFEQKLKETAYLKNKYKFNPKRLYSLKFCKIKNTSSKVTIECDKLNKNQFLRFQNTVFKGNYKINRFTVLENNNTTFIKAEILK